jgi:hypothetical protein
MHVHKWALEDIMNMLPWEREIYVTLLNQHVEEENKRLEARSKKRNG